MSALLGVVVLLGGAFAAGWHERREVRRRRERYIVDIFLRHRSEELRAIAANMQTLSRAFALASAEAMEAFARLAISLRNAFEADP